MRKTILTVFLSHGVCMHGAVKITERCRITLLDLFCVT